ncbi:K+-transporting ATPase ATPase C chain [Constrictibacter sp. MBR-5]|uniref:potassium-transporting ATPase subunit KdpC n=1 Tax=Constrictibacter sp. MBR-5 TaxID=3156467 RepID=UPI0033993B0E
MLSQTRPAVVLLGAMIAITGLCYPLAMTGVASMLFPDQARGSLIVRDGTIVGSARIGQAFTSPGHFHGRPSAAGDGYDAANSGGTNLAPTNRALIEAVRDRTMALAHAAPGVRVPVDLVTSSASGLDPDISPQAAQLQVARVAAARSLAEDAVTHLVERGVRPPFLGLFGPAAVNVLQLNLALDGLGTPPARP